jgi:16S rRNA (adenine1518-N6/adenine1519-N6)-dimethyltransferase
MSYVKPKKHLGQHFLTDQHVARSIAETLQITEPTKVLEIGPGTGVLTQYLLQNPLIDLQVIEIDGESVEYLQKEFAALQNRIYFQDFLTTDVSLIYGSDSFSVIGNFPYNISSQIFFKILENKNQIPCVCGMLQKEVAERLASKPGKKTYGILSVLLQAYYDVEYLFTVPPTVFNPPPKVNSAVIRVTRNSTDKLGCNEVLFKTVIKTAFNQRRKTMRNSLKGIMTSSSPIVTENIFDKRPEQLSVSEFVALTNLIEPHIQGQQ